MPKYSSKQYGNYQASHGKKYVKYPVNEDLSDAYWEATKPNSKKVKAPKDDVVHGQMKDRIASCEQDIEAYFVAHGSLDNFDAPYVKGKQTRKILTDIMTVGVAIARQNFLLKKQAEREAREEKNRTYPVD